MRQMHQESPITGQEEDDAGITNKEKEGFFTYQAISILLIVVFCCLQVKAEGKRKQALKW